MRINALDSHLINIIAAGEVIDRPASIVKELVENSLDAGATRVEVEVQQGGIGVIRISDDGAGIHPDDLALAVQRHATSKISSEHDLEAIQTLGFRGEALASICEVARVTIDTRNAEADEGLRLVINGGQAEPIVATGRGRGTTIEVRDLFFNLPARRKFLKAEKTEAMHITRLMKRFLFSHPNTHFRLIQGKRTLLDSPSSSDLKEIASHLYSAQIAKHLVEVDHQGEMLKVTGWVSTSQLTRGDRNEQYTFVNSRSVSDAVIHYAINRAYEGTLERGRHPYVCLHLEIDPREVDVNVHPQKQEVRFLNSNDVRRDIVHALTQGLVSSHATPKLPWKAAEDALRYTPQRPDVDLKQELGQRRQPFRHPSESRFPEREESAPTSSGLPIQSTRQETPTPNYDQSQPTLMETDDARVVGQLHGTYIVVQTSEGFELIDQHVAHERVLYEAFLKQLGDGNARSQKMLIPEQLKLPPDQSQLLQQHQSLLAKLGIEIEAFGPDTFLLRAWPEALADFHAKVGYRVALEQLLDVVEHEGDPGFEGLAKVLVASLACEAAVVKNTLMPLDAMKHLVKQLRKAEDPFHCPHGRPIILKYGLMELERAFKRR
jgi:DNA mismatch repair protein MutL